MTVVQAATSISLSVSTVLLQAIVADVFAPPQHPLDTLINAEGVRLDRGFDFATINKLLHLLMILLMLFMGFAVGKLQKAYLDVEIDSNSLY